MKTRHTYIACWNPYTFRWFDESVYIAHFFRLKMWQKNHDMRWRSSIEDSIDHDPCEHKGQLFARDVIGKGDRMFVLRTGSDDPSKNGLIYSAFYLSDPQITNNHCLVPFMYDMLMHPNYPTKFTSEYLQERFPKYDWAGTTRGFVLSPKNAYELEKEWYDFFSEHDDDFGSEGPLYCQSKDGFRAMYEWKEENGKTEYGQAQLYKARLHIFQDCIFIDNMSDVEQHLKYEEIVSKWKDED